MPETSRRAVLATGSALVSAALAGCLSDSGSTGPGETGDGEPSDSGAKPSDDQPTDSSAPTEWERSTSCHRRYDSVISVSEVTDEVGDGAEVIHFESLPGAEREILRTVTDAGGYGRCDPSDAFTQFRKRFAERTSDQPAGEPVYLERGGMYYALWIEQGDQAYS